MKKNKIIRFISLVIFVLLIFQLIPTIDYVNDFQSHAQNSKVFLSSGVLHTDVLLIGRERQKTSIQKVQFRNIPLSIPQTSIEGFSAINFSFQEMPFDYRRVIRQTIPHYFNGSKYMSNDFAI